MKRSMAKIRGLSVWYPSQTLQDLPTLNNVDLDLFENETALLVGPSGCGKSTLCLCLNGLIPHRQQATISGKIEVAGRNTLTTSPSEMSTHVQIVFQNPDDQLTCLLVEDEVAFGPENMRFPPRQIEQTVKDLLGFVGLSGFERRVTYDLSGGQKQRLAIAAALSMKPEILVLDAPISNLDPQGASEILSVIDRLRSQRSLTILIVEHNVDEIVPMVDRVILMDALGRIAESNASKEDIDTYVRMKKENLWIPQFAEIALELRQRGIDLGRVPITTDQAVRSLASLGIGRSVVPTSSR